MFLQRNSLHTVKNIIHSLKKKAFCSLLSVLLPAILFALKVVSHSTVMISGVTHAHKDPPFWKCGGSWASRLDTLCWDNRPRRWESRSGCFIFSRWVTCPQRLVTWTGQSELPRGNTLLKVCVSVCSCIFILMMTKCPHEGGKMRGKSAKTRSFRYSSFLNEIRVRPWVKG